MDEFITININCLPDSVLNKREGGIGEYTNQFQIESSEGLRINRHFDDFKQYFQYNNSLIDNLFGDVFKIYEEFLSNKIDHSKHNEFKQCQKKFIKILKNSFSVIEQIYRVYIEEPEIGYIYDIINSK
jgi:hypothetical protein